MMLSTTLKKVITSYHHPTLQNSLLRSISSTTLTLSPQLPPAPEGFIHISIAQAQSTTKQALQKIGWDETDASLQAEIMTCAELCGNNQGLVKMYQPALMAPSPDYAGKPITERETSTSAVINANQSPGMLAAITAADLAAEKVSSKGENDNGPISIVSSYNSSTSSGQLAFYVERMARKGLIGIAFANSPEFVAAAPGGKAVFGTNPLAVGIPARRSDTNDDDDSTTANQPFTFDMATSAIALFGVLSAKAKNEPLPPNVAYAKDGSMTTDATEALEGGGAIATFGGHKGAGLALCVELLAGALSGGAVLGQVESKKVAKSWGHTFIAIRPEDLVDDYDEKVASILETVKASGGGGGENGLVRIPGENSAKIAAERRAVGYMPIPIQIWESIVETSQHGLPGK
mmetsp:Transcript_62429/g.92770  ORF Transcript_62429/g.92770 Transcript_62429/m.92770 type:complete len:404 (+) Transcript_62429:8-1219(+)